MGTLTEEDCTCSCDCQTCSNNMALGGYSAVNDTCPLHGDEEAA